MSSVRPLVLLGSACAVTVLFSSCMRNAAPARTAKPNDDPPANLVRTDFPAWPYPRGIPDTRKDDGTLYHVPGSKQAFTFTQINSSHATIDWFPDQHSAPPAPVIEGGPVHITPAANATSLTEAANRTRAIFARCRSSTSCSRSSI